MPKKENNVTNEELAAMMNRSFESLDRKVDNGFANVEARLDGIESKLDQMQGQIYNVRENISKLTRRVETIEKTEAA